ncbi:MAG: hypothetical protein KA220_07450 [Phenylobacterium sp.]|nr:hypothetical protein [Phenylobacterium sp.]
MTTTTAPSTTTSRGSGLPLNLLILLAVIASTASGYIQIAMNIGQSPAEFAADSDATLKIAPFAFSIWGVIYLGLFVYALWQLFRSGGRTRFMNRMALPALLAFVGIGAWIFVAAWDLEYLSIAVILASAAMLIAPLAAAGPTLDGATRSERLLVGYPLALLGGWLTFASAGNILLVLTGNGLLPAFLPPMGWAIVAIAVVCLIVLWVVQRTRLAIFALPPAWGLVGAWAAEQARNPTLSLIAAGVAAALALFAIATWLGNRRRLA